MKVTLYSTGHEFASPIAQTAVLETEANMKWEACAISIYPEIGRAHV